MTQAPTQPPRPRLAYHHTPGTGPTIVFLAGYASDMTGAKAVMLEAWAHEGGQGFVRFDYRGHGDDRPNFVRHTLADWRDDVVAVIDALAGPIVLVGSSMGGWLMLLATLARSERVVGLVGIAAAPDFTDWGFDPAQKALLATGETLSEPSDYGPEPTLTTARLLPVGASQSACCSAPFAFAGPVRLVQGQADPDVPWHRTVHLAKLIRSSDVQVTWLVKDGDHRLSREADVALIVRHAVEDVLASRL
jgi:pimeloyl-ACP methyl ester carboxylesterase